MNISKRASQRLDLILGAVAVGVIIIAWIIGAFRAEADLQPFIKQAFPEADFLESTPGGIYKAWENKTKEKLLGYVTTGSAHGYGGELKLAVSVSLDGAVLGFVIIEHKETAPFFRRVLKSFLLRDLKDKSYADPFTLGDDVDGVTGATYSSRALAESVRRASRHVATRALSFPSIEEPSPRIQFGLPEAILIALFAFGIIARGRRFKHKKAARWISMLVGIAFLGFLFNKPLTLVLINKVLLGFWPNWQLYLYWYILLAGIVFLTLIGNRNPYCEWFCPFGATQECLGIIGGAKYRVPDRFHYLLRWFQRVIALTAIVIAMIYRNPSVSSYEVFGAFFRLIGTNFLFVLLAIVLIASLFIRRPWCSYLCPLRPVTDFVRLVRNRIRELWLKLR